MDETIDETVDETADISEPQHLLCPITHVMFRDPVMTAAGRTYERSAILEFWRQRFSTHGYSYVLDPMTNQSLQDSRLITNFDKRSEVQVFLSEHADYLPDGWTSRSIPAAEATVVTPTSRTSGYYLAMVLAHCILLFFCLCVISFCSELFYLLKFQVEVDQPEKVLDHLRTGSTFVKLSSLKSLMRLSGDATRADAVLKADAAPHLVQIMSSGSCGSVFDFVNSVCTVLAATTAYTLATKEPDVLLNANVVEAAMILLQHGERRSKEVACYLISFMLHASKLTLQNVGIGKGILESLVEMLRSTELTTRSSAACLLSWLAGDSRNWTPMMDAGILDLLSTMKTSHHQDERLFASVALARFGSFAEVGRRWDLQPYEQSILWGSYIGLMGGPINQIGWKRAVAPVLVVSAWRGLLLSAA
eukprot:TRINITY_DN50102_c0_g1_i1.p1 TRINITY_DN50102_c0_g1~~TRINITY_DN50102_c0_g1_i1.p1  ORF type:complete len:419 (-),score=26.95 TRINITY_DN50102_c0_g1_i1:83-1339(-)